MVGTGKEYPLVWLQGSGCTGCSISALNSVSPAFEHIFINEVLPGNQVSLVYHPTIMAAAGEVATEALGAVVSRGGYILVVEGAIPEACGGVFGFIGEKTIAHVVEEVARSAAVVIGLGTCASFGGIAAAYPNAAGCVGVEELLGRYGIDVPLINLPGCPPHPDWLVGTLAYLLLHGLRLPPLDDLQRPLAYYRTLLHESCPRRACFDEGKFARKPGDAGCLYRLGCKGPVTYCDCSRRLWNGGTNWCIGTGAPCQGCTQPEFPDLVSPFAENNVDVVQPDVLRAAEGCGP